ncbi:MAG: hypothetical protein ACK41W_00085 [Cyanobacteriota bacterium]
MTFDFSETIFSHAVIPMNQFSSQLEAIEIHNIDRILHHPVLSCIRGHCCSNFDFFYDLLLQRRFVSHAITNLYDLAIDSKINQECKTILRRILREEYPDYSGNYPSHREDLVADLEKLGISLNTILNSRATEVTKLSIQAMLDQLLDYSASYSQIKVIAFTRFIGEVLVAEEYKAFWPRISFILGDAAKKKSRFFWSHIRHDQRNSFVDSVTRSSTHASHLGISLVKCIQSENHVSLFKEAENAAVAIKLSFYDQFLNRLP